MARSLASRWKVWLLIAGMVGCVTAVGIGVTGGQPGSVAPVKIPWPFMAVLFTATETWRVFLHFRRNAQSFALSEIPLVVGLFCTDPGGLVVARGIATIIAIGLIHRHPPVKLFFNAALVVLQLEVAEIALNGVLRQDSAPGPLDWLTVVVTMVVLEALGYAFILIAITLTEGAPSSSKVLSNLGFAFCVTTVNTCLALEAVAILWRNPGELWLLVLPIGTSAAAIAAYATERRKSQRMQYLYEASDLLRSAGGDSDTIAALLLKLRSIFQVAYTELTVLPTQRDDLEAIRVRVREGDVPLTERVKDISILEEAMTFVTSGRSGIVVRRDNKDEAVRAMLERRNLPDGMIVALRSEERVTGLLLVGNRASTVNQFGADDLKLFETMAAQVGAALENGRLEAELKHQAFHDTLTNLANRALFTDRINHALARRTQTPGSMVCVLFVDVDDFKLVNDSLGHAGGDTLLREVADRLLRAVRPFDTAARLGGDEFAVLLEEAHSIDEAVSVAERILDVLRWPFRIGDRDITIRASVGISSSSVGTASADELIARADMAMYRAKQRGKGRFEVYEPGMHQAVVARLELKTDLERAIELGDLDVHYQPIVELASGAITGVEALARWRHPKRGMVPPDEFIPLAEDSGIIDALGLFVLERATSDAQRWASFPNTRAPVSVSVNVSARQLHAGFPKAVAGVLAATGLPAHRLILEITEGFIVPDAEAPLELLAELKALGLRLAIDDFGTGYSSLSVLQYLPVDSLKIAKPFIDGIALSSRAEAFARAITRMAHTLSLDIVAEGIETKEQCNKLLALRCGHGQGYYFARPVPVAEFERMLRAGCLVGGDAADEALATAV